MLYEFVINPKMIVISLRSHILSACHFVHGLQKCRGPQLCSHNCLKNYVFIFTNYVQVFLFLVARYVMRLGCHVGVMYKILNSLEGLAYTVIMSVMVIECDYHLTTFNHYQKMCLLPLPLLSGSADWCTSNVLVSFLIASRWKIFSFKSKFKYASAKNVKTKNIYIFDIYTKLVLVSDYSRPPLG